MWVRTARGRALGVIGVRSAHLLRDVDRTTVPAHTEQYIDIGARSAAQAFEMGIRPGDPAGFVGELMELGHGSGRYTAHALDDRAGCAIVLALLDDLGDQPLDLTLVVLFTVQEEVGLRGAQAAMRGQQGDLGLAIDTTALDDTPELHSTHLRLGAGPAIKVLDASLIAHPSVRRGLEEASTAAGVAVQHELLPGIGTDAGALQFGSQVCPLARSPWAPAIRTAPLRCSTPPTSTPPFVCCATSSTGRRTWTSASPTSTAKLPVGQPVRADRNPCPADYRLISA